MNRSFLLHKHKYVSVWSSSPAERARCSFHKADVHASSDEATPHIPSQRLQTYPQTCSRWTVSYGSETRQREGIKLAMDHKNTRT